MAYPTVTVQTLLNRMKFHIYGPGVTDTALDTELQNALQSVLNDMVMRNSVFSLKATFGIQTTPSCAEYALPDDFDKIIEPSLKFTSDPQWTVFWYDQQGYDGSMSSAWYRSSGRPTNYTLQGRDRDTGLFILRFIPTPDAVYALTGEYMSVPERIDTASLTDNLDKRFPPSLWDALVYGGLLRLPQYLGKDRQEGFMQLYMASMTQLAQEAEPVIGAIHTLRPYSTGRVRTNTIFPTPVADQWTAP